MPTWNFSLIFISLIIINQLGLTKTDRDKRQKRFLLFPRQAPTRHQFIAGIGIPADLSLESLTIGYVLKALYYLPYNATVFRENPFFPEYAADYKNSYLSQRKMSEADSNSSPLRWAMYQFMKDRLDSYGYNGQECILKAICEANALSFDRHYNIFAELMHIFLSPKTSQDLSTESTIDYYEAEKLGYNGEEEACEIYNCNLSLLSLISNVFQV